MRINALPNALGNALFPFGAEAQGGYYPPPVYASDCTYQVKGMIMICIGILAIGDRGPSTPL